MNFFQHKSQSKNVLNPPILISFSVVFFLAVVVFRGYLALHLSNDCYHLWFNIKDFPFQASSQGRPLTGLLAFFFDRLGINLVQYQKVFTLLGLFIYSVGIIVLSELLVKLKADDSVKFRVVAGAVSFLLVLNFFAVDMFHYTVMMLPYSLASLLMILACRAILLEQNRFNLLKATVFLTLSVLLYQSYAALFVPVVLIGLNLNSESALSRQEKLRRSFFGLAAYAAALAIDFAYIKLVYLNFFSDRWLDARTSRAAPILENLRYIFRIQDDLWISSFGLLRPYLFLAFAFVFAIAFIFCRAAIKENIRALFFVGVSLAIFYATLFLPHVFSGEIGVSARSIAPFASVPALLIFGFLLYQREWFEKLNLLKFAFLSAVAALFVAQAITINKFAAEGLAINREDEAQARKIVELITDYEYQTGNKINALYFKNDASPQMCRRAGCYVHAKALAVSWSRAESVKFYTGRDFKSFEMDASDFTRLFADKNWDEFAPAQQIKFEGERAYILVF